MTFRLYSDNSCATQVGSNIVRNDVTVTDGLFSVKLNVSQSHFNGQGLWLGVDVGNTGANNVCDEILPVPYALSLRPGAEITGNREPALFARSGYAWAQLATYKIISSYPYSAGVWGWTDDPGSIGVAGDGASYGGYFRGYVGVYGEAANANGHAGVFVGNVAIQNSSRDTIIELGEGLDYAEGFDVSDETGIAPGTVLVIDPDHPGQLTMSDTPYDHKVAGIVAGAQGMGSAVRLGPGRFDHDVALAGRVYCNVDATQTGVEPGDLLTTSDTPGYAMKATDYARAQGAILGKAMESLGKGQKGQILVLVTLQ
jgi:hypothetical protein